MNTRTNIHYYAKVLHQSLVTVTINIVLRNVSVFNLFSAWCNFFTFFLFTESVKSLTINETDARLLENICGPFKMNQRREKDITGNVAT